jgi:EAL domain-containing protein (putative c-di-GMP-specific phosphodiesterase class I)
VRAAQLPVKVTLDDFGDGFFCLASVRGAAFVVPKAPLGFIQPQSGV